MPEAAVLVVAEEVAADGLAFEVGAAGNFLQDVFFDRAGVGGGGVVEGGGERGEGEAEEEERGEEPQDAASGAENGDDFVAPRHLGEGVEDGEEQADRQAHDNDLGHAEEVKLRDARKRGFVLEESRCILAQVEDQPDGDEPQHAVKERLKDANEDVSIDNLHDDGRAQHGRRPGCKYPAEAGRHQSV